MGADTIPRWRMKMDMMNILSSMTTVNDDQEWMWNQPRVLQQVYSTKLFIAPNQRSLTMQSKNKAKQSRPQRRGIFNPEYVGSISI